MRRYICVLSSFAALLCLAQIAGAQVSTLSDRMVISDPSGAVVFDNTIPEIATAGELPLVFGGGPGPVAPAISPGVAVTIPGVSVVLLLEPAGEPIEPGETPIYIPIPGGRAILSDAIISLPIGTAGNNTPQIMFVSDGGPDLDQIAVSLANAPVPPTILTETGDLQDISTFLGLGSASPFAGYTVQVQSDVVPEPGSLMVLGLGAIGLLARRRRLA
jgi:hypothetical protein